MNSYISPDQNTVVVWADENAPRLLDYSPTTMCPNCALFDHSGIRVRCLGTYGPNSRSCCGPRRGRTVDGSDGTFVPRRPR
jgi:hypothetical protein